MNIRNADIDFKYCYQTYNVSNAKTNITGFKGDRINGVSYKGMYRLEFQNVAVGQGDRINGVCV